MLHIGYIVNNNIEIGHSIILDSARKAHYYKCVNQLPMYTFVTFEGEDDLVTSVVPLNTYTKVPNKEIHPTWIKEVTPNRSLNFDLPLANITLKPIYKDLPQPPYIIEMSHSHRKYILVDKSGNEYEITDGAESYIIGLLFEGKETIPEQYSMLPLEQFQMEMTDIIKQVDLISNQLHKIADSYTITLKETFIRKLGDDNRFYVDREVTLSYRDTYINTFFKDNKTLLEKYGFTERFDNPYGVGRQIEEENLDKANFIEKYNKQTHLTYLLYENLRKKVWDINKIERSNNHLYILWGIQYPELSTVPFSNKFPYTTNLESFVDSIRRYNTDHTMKIAEFPFNYPLKYTKK